MPSSVRLVEVQVNLADCVFSRMKKRQFDQQKIAVIENLHTINDTRKFYQAIRSAKNGFQPRTSMCRKKNGDLVCDSNGVLERWKEHFDELLNAGADERQEAKTS
jgi:hypothetical protein